MAEKDELGRRGEAVAAAWLEASGRRVIARNWRCTIGEVDLVAREGTTTIVIEVKTRTTVAFGHPFEAITHSKRSRLRRLAAEWCRENGPLPGTIRIDAIAVIDAWEARPSVQHLAGIA